MATLTYDFDAIFKALTISKSKNFDSHIKEVIQAIPARQKYSSKLVTLLQKTLKENPSSRARKSDLKSLL